MQPMLFSPNGPIEGDFDGGWGIRVIGMSNVYDESFPNDQDKGVWAIPDVQHLKQLMRYAFTHEEEGKRKGRAGRRKIVQTYSQEAAACAYLKEFQKYPRVSR